MTERQPTRIIRAVETADGAGVRLRRSLGSVRGLYLDPFLLLDEFSSDNPDDYIAGFPSHPHRGFETVTYMLDGLMRHEDHLGNVGDLGPGDVQWMRAGRGVIHSEMPRQIEGRMRGFQLWINLPAADKMQPAAYRNLGRDDIPEINDDAGRLRLVAGAIDLDGQSLRAPINPERAHPTDPLYLDVELAANAARSIPLPAGHNAFVYVFEGSARIGDATEANGAHTAAVLSDGDAVRIAGGSSGARVLLIAGRPIGEPVVQYGPFVMNTRDEIEQAVRDYRDGRLTG